MFEERKAFTEISNVVVGMDADKGIGNEKFGTPNRNIEVFGCGIYYFSERLSFSHPVEFSIYW